MANVDQNYDADRGNPLIDALADWLVGQALRDVPLDDVFGGTCRQLYAAGIPVARGHISFRVLHPLFEAQSLEWRRDQKVFRDSYLHGASVAAQKWERSPFYHMLMNDVPYVRRHLTGEAAILDFEMLEDLKEEGFTDYLAFMVKFDETAETSDRSNGIIGSWTTDRARGFSNNDIRSLRRIEQRLAVAFKINIQAQITHNILAAYLGPGAGAKVLNGQIKRGDGEVIHCVIWYSDMRDSTRLADSLSGQSFIQALNCYFESTAGAVLKHGGEVLRFIGDAVLAIFPIDAKHSASQACRAALDAVRTAQQNLAVANRERHTEALEPLDFGLGLHVGEVLFGNIGVPERVEFSVIGPAANEAARLESLTKQVGERVLVSDDFARHLALDWVPAGEHALKGVNRSVAVFIPPDINQ